MKNIELTDENSQNLETFKPLLNKDTSEIINEALKQYFIDETEKLKDINNSQTNLSYDEFWDDVEL